MPRKKNQSKERKSIDKSVKDLLNNDLHGLKGDYTEKVQAIVDEDKQKKF